MENGILSPVLFVFVLACFPSSSPHAVCTTEIVSLAEKYDALEAMDCKIATLSVDPVESHEKWLHDVVAMAEGKINVRFPIIADPRRDISTAYGMIDPWTSDRQELPLTIRCVYSAVLLC